MDFNNSCEVTVVPSITFQTFQTTSLSNTVASSIRTLSTINEQESERDFYLPFDKNERRNENINCKRLKITSLPFNYQELNQELNQDFSRSSLESDKRMISILHENEKKYIEIKDKINVKDTHFQIHKDMNNTSNVPFFELGAVCKILNFISDLKVSSSTNNCCNEILRTLQYLLTQHHDKKLEDLLLNDSSFYKCERCGVISYTLKSNSAIKESMNETKSKHNETTMIKRNCINSDHNNEESEISISSPHLKTNVKSRINDLKMNNPVEYTDKLSEMELLSTKERAFVARRNIGTSNETNNIKTNIKNKFYLDNNAINQLFNMETRNKRNKKYDSAVRNNGRKHESSNTIKASAGIDKEEVIREISYEAKSQIDDLLARDRLSNIAQKIQGSQGLFYKHGDIYPIIDTMKYLAVGQFTELDKREDEFLSKLQERRNPRLEVARNGQSSVLYDIRDDYPQSDAGFWLFDESGHLPQIALDKYHYLPTMGIDNNGRNVNFSTNIPHSNTIEKIKTDSCSNYMEKDSLEDLLEQKKESDATVFSSSSVENSIHERMEFLQKKYKIFNIDDEDIPRGRKLVSSRPSLDIARHVRAQIAKDKHSGKAKRSINELRNSNVLVRLSPETRRKVCHLIKTIVSSDEDSIFFYEKYLTSGVFKNEKLLHSKSVDAAFVYSNKCYKIDNKLINNCANDRISMKLSELSEDKNRLLKEQDLNTCNQNLIKSKSFTKNDNTVLISSNKLANNSTKITRQIIYKDASLKNFISNDREILSTYRKILENSKDMDWDNFRELVEILHPGEKELWRDICRTINEEATRIVDDVDGNTEICIEISPVNPEETSKTSDVTTFARKIIFELDMMLKDENLFNKKLEECLDTHKDVNLNGECKTKQIN